MNEINDKIIKAQDEQIELQKDLINDYKRILSEISSQLKDRGGFDIITKSIDNTLNK